MTAAPKRIQLRRTKGWRKPEGAIVVGRPSRWGNPFPVHDTFTHDRAVAAFHAYLTTTADDCIPGYRRQGYPTDVEIREHLAGHDLLCWCPLDHPCHADTLLEWANG